MLGLQDLRPQLDHGARGASDRDHFQTRRRWRGLSGRRQRPQAANDEGVIARPANQHINGTAIARAGVENIIAGPASKPVRARAAIEPVIARAADEPVAPAVTIDLVVAGAAMQHFRIGPVIPGGAGAARAMNNIVARAAIAIVRTAAKKTNEVITGAAPGLAIFRGRK